VNKGTASRASGSGQAFLSTVLIIGGVMILIGATVAVLAATFVDSGYGLQASNQAESVATAGVNDAYLQLDRNAAFSSSGYSVSVPNGSETVVVTQGSGSSAGTATVLSSATVNGRTRKISALFSISTSTGQVILALWQDVQ
jgi:hypothetical protein